MVEKGLNLSLSDQLHHQLRTHVLLAHLLNSADKAWTFVPCHKYFPKFTRTKLLPQLEVIYPHFACLLAARIGISRWHSFTKRGLTLVYFFGSLHNVMDYGLALWFLLEWFSIINPVAFYFPVPFPNNFILFLRLDLTLSWWSHLFLFLTLIKGRLILLFFCFLRCHILGKRLQLFLKLLSIPLQIGLMSFLYGCTLSLPPIRIIHGHRLDYTIA